MLAGAQIYFAEMVEGTTFYAYSCSISETRGGALYLHATTEGYNAWNEKCLFGKEIHILDLGGE